MGLRGSSLITALAAGVVVLAATAVTAAPTTDVAPAPESAATGASPVGAPPSTPPTDAPPDHVDPPAPPFASPEPEGPRINDVQARGTHNSTHLDPHGVITDGAPFNWGYSHRNLTAQYEEQGVRQVEIDIHYNWAKDDFDVYHVWFGDDRATCDTLSGCLGEIRAWSDDHPSSVPLMILIEPKDSGLPWSARGASTDYEAHLPEDGDPFTRPLDEHAYQRLDQILLESFGGRVADGGRVLTPDDVMHGEAATLRDSILTHGWPTVDESRGQVLFVVDGPDHAEPYSHGWEHLAGRTMFVQAEADLPVAAFVSRDGERLDGESKYDRMRRLVAAGFMVRDLTSPDRFEEALAAGAHYLSTDFPDQLVFDDPDSPVRCNPVALAGTGRTCTATGLEEHVPHGYDVPDDPPDTEQQAALDKVDRLVVGSVESAVALATAEPGSRSPLP